jgi:hypothetical protein
MRALSYAVRHIFTAEGLVVPMQAEEGLLDTEVLEEKPAVAGVLGSNQVGSLQNLNSPQGDILTVSDGCGNNA